MKKRTKALLTGIMALTLMFSNLSGTFPTYVYAEGELPADTMVEAEEPQTVDKTIADGSAKLEKDQVNLSKVSDKEYIISFPGVTEGTPLNYKTDFENTLGGYKFSANVKDSAGKEELKEMKLNAQSKLDYSAVTNAVDENGNIPTGTYELILDFSKVASTWRDWNDIAFSDGSQIVTIKVVVGTKWDDASKFEPYKIKTVSPENVNFNLFDYWVESETAHDHLQNGTKNKFTLPTCGIPSCIGDVQKVSGNNWQTSLYYHKGINLNHALIFSPAGNLTGGWNFNTNDGRGDSYAEFHGGPYRNLVKNTLGQDGYPVLNLEQSKVDSTTVFQGENRPANESLAYLFSASDTDSKKVYEGVSGLLKRDSETGNYKYSSLENFASYDKTTNSFNVYNSWAVQGGDSINGQFFPFNTAAQVFKTDSDGNPVLTDGILQPDEKVNSSYSAFINHYLGMTMDVEFQQPVNGTISNMGKASPMQFQFTGDDDVWVFIDDVLVADIGGVHDTITTTIDFKTGKVKVDRADRFDNETDTAGSRIETTIREQFENAGKDTSYGFDGDTFADNTVHTLKMFYMERGNQASNLELEFNLMEPRFSSIEKVDQDGNGLDGVTFALYEADENWKPQGDAIAELTTANGGSVDFVKERENGTKEAILFDESKNYVLREIETLPGYVTQGDIHLNYDAGTGTLKVDNKWETGAVGGFEAQVTMTSNLSDSQGNDLTEKGRQGLIIAMPLYNPTENKGAEVTEGWQALYGSVFEGFKPIRPDESISDANQRYRQMVLEAALRQFSDADYEQWHLDWNDELERYEGTLSDLPGSVDKYIFVDKENGDMLMAYYLLNPSDGLFADCTTSEEKCEKLAQLVSGGNIDELVDKYQSDLTLLNLDSFNRQFYSRLYVPNKARDLWVLKQDVQGQPLANAEFTLYDDKACSNAVAKGITDENGYISFSVQNTGNNAAENPDGGLTSKVKYALSQNLNEETGEITEKYLYLKETKAPDGYRPNSTVTKVLVTNDYMYVDAGSERDRVSVVKGIGKLVDTMARYASSNDIDITLRDVTATKYKYTGDLNADGFPVVAEHSNWKKDTSEEPLNLHYGLNGAILDYGIHETDRDPAFHTETGWIGIGVNQNKAHTDKDDEYYSETAQRTDLEGVDISALFTGSTVIVVKDKWDNPEKGGLTVEKEVTGTHGDKDKEFHFTVTLDDTSINGTYGDMDFKDGVAEFTLKHGDKVTATGLPADTDYIVEEKEANEDGYTTSAAADEGMIPENDNAEVKFINHKEVNSDNPDSSDESKKPGNPDTPDNPKTGDQTNLGFCISMLAAASLFFAVTLVLRKKKRLTK